MFNLMHEIYCDMRASGAIIDRDIDQTIRNKNKIEDFDIFKDRESLVKAIVNCLFRRVNEQNSNFRTTNPANLTTLSPRVLNSLHLSCTFTEIQTRILDIFVGPPQVFVVKGVIAFPFFTVIKESEIAKRAELITLADKTGDLIIKNNIISQFYAKYANDQNKLDSNGLFVIKNYLHLALKGDRQLLKGSIKFIICHELGHIMLGHKGNFFYQISRQAKHFIFSLLATIIIVVVSAIIFPFCVPIALIPVGICLFKLKQLKRLTNFVKERELYTDLFSLHHFPENANGAVYFWNQLDLARTRFLSDKSFPKFTRLLIKIFGNISITHPKFATRRQIAQDIVTNGSVLKGCLTQKT